LHQPLTFVLPFYNPQRRYLYFVTLRLLRVLPVGATVHFTPILHQPLTFVLPFYNPQRRVFSKNKISLRFINNPGSDFVSRYRAMATLSIQTSSCLPRSFSTVPRCYQKWHTPKRVPSL